MKSKLVVVLLALIIILSTYACGRYYKVKDPVSGNVYYTTEVEQKRKTGVVMLKDAKTGSQVTLQNSEVIEIDKKEFKANTQKK